MSNLNWWQGAIIYQVYPRSFYDTNNDGIGDIPGIIAKLDYIASLGVDAIWISPFFKSPMKDFGYDISDYRAVDPIFGELDDFDRLIEEAHKKGLKIMIDQVPSHTSDQHAWFQESRQDKTNPKADWYVWADAKPDGSPPNNWLSVFGGSAWEWDEGRQQFYLHNFLKSQPDINYHSAEVRDQILKEITFWLDRGVDGLRLDAINFCYHDALLRDNPLKPEEDRKGRGFSSDNPYASYYHRYDNTQPENLDFMQAIRDLLNRYPGTVSLGEINSDTSLKTIAEYTRGDKRLHMGYSFELLADEYSKEYICETVETLEKEMQGSWPCWAISNHDVARVASRWGKNGEHENARFATMLSMLVSTLRGGVCTYQGEELGLTEADIAFDDVQDPFGLAFWPKFKGRDGCRTPMPWYSDQENAGFSSTKPWLPIANKHLSMSVDLQEQDKQSPLNIFRAFAHWRKTQNALRLGDFRFIDSPDEVIAIERKFEDETIVAYFNLSQEDKTINGIQGKGIELDFSCGEVNGDILTLPALGAFFSQV